MQMLEITMMKRLFIAIRVVFGKSDCNILQNVVWVKGIIAQQDG